MSFTEFETAQQAAVRLGVTPRAIQKWAAEGRISGAAKHGKSWMIPKNAVVTENADKGTETPDNVPDVYQMSPFRMAMPLLNSTYPVGKVMEYIETIPDKADRDIALAEYYFFSGQSKKCAKAVTEYQDSHDPSFDIPGSADPSDNPQTGGNSHMALWIALLFISGGAATTLCVYDKKEKTGRNLTQRFSDKSQ